MHGLPNSLGLSLVLALAVAPQVRADTPKPAVVQAAPAKTGAGKTLVSAANPLAVAAGVKVLKAGGKAVDAAIAVQAVLGLVEPQSSGLGGGAFMIYYNAKTGKITAYDGREVAPMGASADMFTGADGKPLPFSQAVVSGRATGVPGAIAMLYVAHKDHGKKPWKSLFGDAETMASEGFKVSPRLATFLTGGFPQVSQPDVLAYFTKPDGQKYQAGDVLKNQAYADTLKRLAAQGPDAILKGPTAARIAARIGGAPLPGTMTTADLAAYKPKVTEALCRPYREYKVCTPQPPSGGVGLLELLAILEQTDIGDHKADVQGWYLFAQASRLMYADRDHYIGDPAFVKAPVQGLLAADYAKRRAALIGDKAGPVTWGQPEGALARGPDATVEPGGTSSFVIADADGDVLAMTTTVESIFGTGRMVDGFFLNNQLTDFSFSPKDTNGMPAANAVGPGKRPRSTMSPTLVFDKEGKLYAAIGSPGGASIVAYVGKTLVGLLDWKLPMDQAIALPNIVARGPIVGAEANLDPAILDGMKAKGLNMVGGRGENSGLHGLVALPDGRYMGAADPRREGVAGGF
jgi:gamma-glutamyltranspeptidase/glutathione hydrolase